MLPSTVSLTNSQNQVQSFLGFGTQTFTGSLAPGQWKFVVEAVADHRFANVGPTPYGAVATLQLPEPSGAVMAPPVALCPSKRMSVLASVLAT